MSFLPHYYPHGLSTVLATDIELTVTYRNTTGPLTVDVTGVICPAEPDVGLMTDYIENMQVWNSGDVICLPSDIKRAIIDDILQARLE